MLKAIFTLDYEIHGNGEGCPQKLMVEPTGRMMDLFEQYGAKLTIMADVAEILKFREYKEQQGRDDYHSDAIEGQLRDAIRRGHDVQLHLHASYFNARHAAGYWRQDWSEYNFAGLGLDRLRQMVKLGKEYLETLLRPINSRYCCSAFRAANWSVSPSANVVRALVENGIQIDTSVFKHGRRNGLVNFDYSQAFSALLPWRASEADINRVDKNSSLFEFPIYTEARWVGAFLTPQRIYRSLMSRAHKVSPEKGNATSIGVGGNNKKRQRGLSWLAERQAWKADFNQCSGRQLIRALDRAEVEYGNTKVDLPFVLIGHSKLFSRFNQWSLRSFLKHVAKHPNRFGFATFAEFNLKSLDSTAM
jgi:hypothetical protein